MKHSMQRFFTLIELLALIFVIVILAELLLPAIQHAKQTAYLAQCADNMKQMGAMLNSYTLTYNNYVTPLTLYDSDIKAWPGFLWNSLAGASTPLMPITTKTLSNTDWKEAVKASKTFVCPADKATAAIDDRGSDTLPNTSYAVNRYALTKEADWTRSSVYSKRLFQITKIKIPSHMIYVCDTAMNSPYNDKYRFGSLYSTKGPFGYSYSQCAIHPYDQAIFYPTNGASTDYDSPYTVKPFHNGNTWNYLFLDGHCRNLYPQQTVLDKTKNAAVTRLASKMWTYDYEYH